MLHILSGIVLQRKGVTLFTVGTSFFLPDVTGKKGKKQTFHVFIVSHNREKCDMFLGNTMEGHDVTGAIPSICQKPAHVFPHQMGNCLEYCIRLSGSLALIAVDGLDGRIDGKAGEIELARARELETDTGVGLDRGSNRVSVIAENGSVELRVILFEGHREDSHVTTELDTYSLSSLPDSDSS